ncbi:MAG TPA: hypothetical protein VFZ02_10595, partial [Ktedonobacteraceae bacterium]
DQTYLLLILRMLCEHGNWHISVQYTLKSCSNYIMLHKYRQMLAEAYFYQKPGAEWLLHQGQRWHLSISPTTLVRLLLRSQARSKEKRPHITPAHTRTEILALDFWEYSLILLP